MPLDFLFLPPNYHCPPRWHGQASPRKKVKHLRKFGECVFENSCDLAGKGNKHAQFSEASVDLTSKGNRHGHCIVGDSDLTIFFENVLDLGDRNWLWDRRGRQGFVWNDKGPYKVRNCKRPTEAELKGCGQRIEKSRGSPRISIWSPPELPQQLLMSSTRTGDEAFSRMNTCDS